MGWLNNAGNLSQAHFTCKSNCRFCAKVPLPSLDVVPIEEIEFRENVLMAQLAPEENSNLPTDSGDPSVLLTRRLLILLSGGLVMLLGLVFPFPMSGRHWNAIFDLAHAPAFFLIFLLAVGVLDPSSIGLSKSRPALLRLPPLQLILLSGLLFLGGVACEVAQKFVHRHPSVGDIIANSLGLLAGMLYCLSRKSVTPVFRVTGLIFTMLVIILPCIAPIRELVECLSQRHEFPQLASFERPRELTAWIAHGARFRISNDWASHGSSSMKIESSGAHDPGALMVWPIPDWSQYFSLEFTVFNPDQSAVVVGVTISDDQHVRNLWESSDRFNWSIELGPNETKLVSIELHEVANAPVSRRMDMTRISNLNIYLQNPPADATFHVDGVQLLK